MKRLFFEGRSYNRISLLAIGLIVLTITTLSAAAQARPPVKGVKRQAETVTVGVPLPEPVNVTQDCWTTDQDLDPDIELELYTFTTDDSIEFVWKQKLLLTCSAYLASIYVFDCIDGKPRPGAVVYSAQNIDFGQLYTAS